tara:strand:- start:60 stop:254 length:195 start_codon:yes stop_codon:yes gene_type:complete
MREDNEMMKAFRESAGWAIASDYCLGQAMRRIDAGEGFWWYLMMFCLSLIFGLAALYRLAKSKE